jgi:hypothetical protein
MGDFESAGSYAGDGEGYGPDGQRWKPVQVYPGEKKLFVGNLGFDTTDDKLKAAFEEVIMYSLTPSHLSLY